MRIRWVVVCLLFVTLFAPAASAQTAGTLTGLVTDPSGAVLPGATITAQAIDTGLTRTVVTAADGGFVVAALPPGIYEVRAELSGFKPHVRKEVDVAVADTVHLDIRLQLGDLAIEDVVVGVVPLVNTSTPELSYLVHSEAIERLPLNGRNYTDLMLLQPGVMAYPHRDGGSVVAHGLGMSVNGQDPRSNVYLLDGTLQNDFTNGPAGSAAGTALGMDTIREFRVEANAYSAEFGRNSGGQ
ncbi:MAG TPA: carboxypeptidase-like regulatory domain-containing protein, partial [Vicinamibacterales bacterium]